MTLDIAAQIDEEMTRSRHCQQSANERTWNQCNSAMRLVAGAQFVCLIDGSVVDAQCVNEKKTNFEWLALEWQEYAPCRSDTDDGDVFF